MKRIKTINELHFDGNNIDEDKSRFYLNTPEGRSVSFDILKKDVSELETLLKRNDISYELDDGGKLPF